MKIQTKHNIGDTVFYLDKNKITKGEITHMQINIDDKSTFVFVSIGDKTSYSIEDKYFSTKEELARSLLSD